MMFKLESYISKKSESSFGESRITRSGLFEAFQNAGLQYQDCLEDKIHVGFKDLDYFVVFQKYSKFAGNIILYV